MTFGTVATETGSVYREEDNPLLVPSPLYAKTVAPFGRPQIQQIRTHEYATLSAAMEFCKVLYGQLITADDPKYDGAEEKTFTVPYPKYVILCGKVRVNAGSIAWIIGDDTAWGITPSQKAGFLAKELDEPFRAEVHIPLMNALLEAAVRAV